jgi:hypothetical protein
MRVSWITDRIQVVDLKLVQAQIALFKGERAETLRLLNEYRETHADDPMVMWLEAQAQSDREARMQRLQVLAGRHDSTYGQLAQDTLRVEADYLQKIEAARRARSFDPTTRRLIGLVGVVVIGILILVSLGVGQTPVEIPTPTVTIAPTVVSLPDRSRVLVADSYTARYPRGILQVTAIEDESARVIRREDQTLVIPVPGARFFALKIVFECRGGVCNQPPEARLRLQLSNGETIDARDDIKIANDTVLEAIALGRTTAGWVIFEIPTVTSADALLVTPPNESAEAAFEGIRMLLN